MTKTSFADYVATQDARNTIQLNIRKYCLMLCDALLMDIERQHPNSGYKFFIEEGRKYHKIVQTDTSGGGAVHAFVDKKTGEVYKPASWRGPAKDVRFDLRLIEQREWVLENCDWAGGYLYKK